MTRSHINDAAHWRDRAEEMRVAAEDMKNEECKIRMQACAIDYDMMARRAEKRAAGEKTS